MKALLPHIDKSWTLFLDRDGVINKRIVDGYVVQWADFEFLDGVLEALSFMSGLFGRIVVVTNQQCVAKGLVSEEGINAISREMCQAAARHGATIDAVIMCPQLATEPDNYRKPNPRMAFIAKEMMPEIDFAKSVMVGDSESDILFGKNVGMVTVKVAGHSDVADYNFDTLYDFSKQIKDER